MGLRGMIDSTLTQIRLTGQPPWRERIRVSDFIDYRDGCREPAHGGSRDYLRRATRRPGPGDRGGPAAPPSAVMNLLINAFKYTHLRGRVGAEGPRRGRARAASRSKTSAEGSRRKRTRSGRSASSARRDRTGLGLGLSIARQAIRAHGGDIHIRNIQGRAACSSRGAARAGGRAQSTRERLSALGHECTIAGVPRTPREMAGQAQRG